MRSIVAGIALLVSWSAIAATIDYEITPVMENEDGSVLTLDQITSTLVLYGKCNAAKADIEGAPQYMRRTAGAVADIFRGSLPNIGGGSWCVKARVDAASGPGTLSAVSVVEIPSVPKAPTLKVTVR